MQRHQTHLLGIYTHTNDFAKSKRKLLSSVTAPDIPMPLLDQQTTTSTKFLLCLAKLASELKRALSDFLPHEEDRCLLQLSAIAQGLKNDRELLSQEEAVIAELKRMREEWEQQKDPLVRYEQGERQALRERLGAKVKELQRWEGMGRSAKKPLYVRKLQRQLRQNLQRAAESERAFNSQQQARYLSARARLLKAAGRLAGAGGRMNRESLVNETKNKFLRNYIDRFNEGSKMGERQFQTYRQDYLRTLQEIGSIFKQELYRFSLLLQFSGKFESAAMSCYRGVLAAEDQFSLQAQRVSQEIFTIVSPREVIEVVHNCKHFFAFTREWQQARPRMKKAQEPLEEGAVLIKQATQRIGRQREGKGPRKTSPVQQFILDKKFMETLVKKQTLFQEALLSAWQAFIEGYLHVLQQAPTVLGSQGQSRSGKSKLQSAFDRLFISYLGETESDRQELSLRHSNSTFIAQIEHLIASIPIFSSEVDWTGSYACSLGPRLLIHGRAKALPQGLYYESNFNQRNYFFGRTRLFLPKEEIFQINKQTVLLLFPDVLQMVTKHGPVYLHALGKRETMYQNFIDFYLPEVKDQHREQQIQFNQFKGDANVAQQRLGPFLGDLQAEILKMTLQNIDLPAFFHKYWSNTEFSYQGSTHKDFKHYLCLLAEGKNTRCSDFTPGVPYYFLPKSNLPPTQDIVESQRLMTYQRKIPSIPFVSKGGDGICHQKVLFRWGGPRLMVIDLCTTLSGFAMTDSMTVRARQVIKDLGGGVEMRVSGQVQFTNSSPLNPMIRTPALSNLKDFWVQVSDKLSKMQRNRPAAGTGKKLECGIEREGEEDRIQELQLEVVSLRKKMKIMGAAFAVIYIVSLLLFFVL